MLVGANGGYQQYPEMATTRLGLVFNVCSTLLHCVQDELGVSRELMYNLPLEKKWELYLSKQKVKHKLIVI